MNLEIVKNEVLSASNGYVSLNDLELECLKDILTSNEKIVTSFVGVSREIDGIFIITDKRVVFIARPGSMKDFQCLNYEHTELSDVRKYEDQENAGRFLICMITDDGNIFDLDQLTKERADLLYRMFLDFLGEQHVEPKKRTFFRRSLTVIGVLFTAGFLLLVLGSILFDLFIEEEVNYSDSDVVIDVQNNGITDTENFETVPVSNMNNKLTINYTEKGPIDIGGVFDFEYVTHFFSDEVNPPNYEGFTVYAMDDELFTFLVVEALVTNNSSQAINISLGSPLNMPLILNEVHDYLPMVDYLINDNSEFAFYEEVKKDTTVTAYYMYRFPKKYMESDESIILNLEKINEDYSLDYITSIRLR
ncbi:hypothetical protein [Alkalihalobacterium elongatum]|uniref:hypothetical protein n=1 Tax=Alkalihalobacterium elongatum TaxID=2675466 RepID=UPI001C2001B4|nr:hypothetical protein [Alkalihalobacterium elongatum]